LLTVELIAHMAAGDRALWQGDQEERPLSVLGCTQARLLCQDLADMPVDGLFSSPALRCRQTLEPLAASTGLLIETLPSLRETDGFPPPAGWGDFLRPESAYGGARAAGSAYAALALIRSRVREGRIAVCSHGDIVPALLAFLGAAHGVAIPEPWRPRPMWYTLQFQDERLSVVPHPPSPDFPN
jgi:8-oxo-dGTP diphosphatase